MLRLSRLSARVRRLFRPAAASPSSRALTSSPMAQRTYADAVDHLNSLQSNAATLEAVRASGGRLSDMAIPEMLEYLGRIGYSVCLAISTHNIGHFTLP